MNFKFSFGKVTRSTIQWAVIASIFTSLVAGLHQCTNVSEDKIYDLVDELQRNKTHNKKLSEINQYIIKTPKLLNRRVHRDIDGAVEKYKIQEKNIYKPSMKNKDIINEIESEKYTPEQRTIINDAVYYECSDGTMGIHAVWYSSKECSL
jgi:hypothetical protein